MEPGDWTKIHRIERKRGVVEEAVCCWNCNAFLLASPDDDIDPLVAGEEYDKNIYHKFVRPEGWAAPKQRTSNKNIEVGDWVVLSDDAVVELCVEGKTRLQKMPRAEGEVLERAGDLLTIDFRNLFESAKSGTVDAAHARAMVFEQFAVGTPVRVTRGPLRNQLGHVHDLGEVNSSLAIELHETGEVVLFPQEWLTVYIPDNQEQPHG